MYFLNETLSVLVHWLLKSSELPKISADNAPTYIENFKHLLQGPTGLQVFKNEVRTFNKENKCHDIILTRNSHRVEFKKLMELSKVTIVLKDKKLRTMDQAKEYAANQCPDASVRVQEFEKKHFPNLTIQNLHTWIVPRNWTHVETDIMHQRIKDFEAKYPEVKVGVDIKDDKIFKLSYKFITCGEKKIDLARTSKIESITWIKANCDGNKPIIAAITGKFISILKECKKLDFDDSPKSGVTTAKFILQNCDMNTNHDMIYMLYEILQKLNLQDDKVYYLMYTFGSEAFVKRMTDARDVSYRNNLIYLKEIDVKATYSDLQNLVSFMKNPVETQHVFTQKEVNALDQVSCMQLEKLQVIFGVHLKVKNGDKKKCDYIAGKTKYEKIVFDEEPDTFVRQANSLNLYDERVFNSVKQFALELEKKNRTLFMIEHCKLIKEARFKQCHKPKLVNIQFSLFFQGKIKVLTADIFKKITIRILETNWLPFFLKEQGDFWAKSYLAGFMRLCVEILDLKVGTEKLVEYDLTEIMKKNGLDFGPYTCVWISGTIGCYMVQ